MAELPPPMTATSRPLKKNPSQVAQAETPKFWKRFSEAMPSQRAEAPVAMTSVSPTYVSPESPVA